MTECGGSSERHGEPKLVVAAMQAKGAAVLSVRVVTGGDAQVVDEARRAALIEPSEGYDGNVTGVVTLLVCERTSTFRHCARRVPLTQAKSSGKYFEIGCSYGVSTDCLARAVCCDDASFRNSSKRLAARRKSSSSMHGEVVACDISEEAIQSARSRYLSCRAATTSDCELCSLRFEVVDALSQGDMLVSLGSGSSHCFIDIAGTRPLDDVVRICDAVAKLIAPPVIVVKSEALYRHLIKHSRPELVHGEDGDDCWGVFTDAFANLRASVSSRWVHGMRDAFARNTRALPHRFLRDRTTRLCWHHNYLEGGCPRGDSCEFSHQMCCHICGSDAHLARDCLGHGPLVFHPSI